MPLISSQTTKANYRISTVLPQNKGKHKQKKALPSTEVGVVPEMIVTGILRVVNHHVVDIKNYAMSIKNVISVVEVVLRSKEKSDNKKVIDIEPTSKNTDINHNEIGKFYSNATQSVKIISIIEPSRKQRHSIKPEKSHNAVDVNYCVEISSKRYNNLNCGCFEKGKETKSNKQNCNESSVVPVTNLIVETLQSMSMIETLSKRIGNQLGKKLYKSELCMLDISKKCRQSKAGIDLGDSKPRSVDFLDGSCLIYSSTKLLK